jgi:hypothetical protein
MLLSRELVDAAAMGDNVLIAGVPDRSIHVFQLWLVVTDDVTIQFYEGARAADGPVAMLASGSVVLDDTAEPWFVTDPGDDFILNLSAAVQVSGRAYYRLRA